MNDSAATVSNAAARLSGFLKNLENANQTLPNKIGEYRKTAAASTIDCAITSVLIRYSTVKQCIRSVQFPTSAHSFIFYAYQCLHMV